jgi:glycosyltransferase involved in cell wall biosynthesis
MATFGSTTKSRKKIAWLSPFPPQKSGIANYSYWLVKALQPYFDIDLYLDQDALAGDLGSEFNARLLNDFAKRHREYDEAIFHVGNNAEFHKTIYELAWNFPGTLVLHDYDLSGFFQHAFSDNKGRRFYEQVISEERAEEQRMRGPGPTTDIGESPMSKAIVARSKKVIVHHRWVRNQFPARDHIHVIPMIAKQTYVPTSEEIESFKRSLNIKSDYFVVSCFGFVNMNKLPQLQIEVVKRLLNDGYPVQMLFVGEPSEYVADLVAESRSNQFRENIIFTGFQSEADYFSALQTSDVVINLRNPSMGEGSLTLMQALAAGKPTIISDSNQYREFPDKVCWKIRHDEHQAEVLYEYLKVLLGDRNLRQAISANASEFVKTVFAWDEIVASWVNLIAR